MSKSNAFENDFLKLIFNATAIANVADNAVSGPLTSLFVSLHTADPGEAGDQTTSEASYGAYARVAVARSGAGWVVTGASVSPAANIDFPEATSGSQTLTHFAVGKALSGASAILYSGTISPSINVSAGVAPRLTTSTVITED